MTSRTRVIRAIERKGPDRVPIYIPQDPLSDIAVCHPGTAADFRPSKQGETEWGFVWEKIDLTMGQPKENPLADWAAMEQYRVPDPMAPGRFANMDAVKAASAGKYLLGGMGITGFDLMTFIRGFSQVLEDLYFEREKCERLADMVFGYEEGIIRGFGERGVDGVTFYDDWGTQNSLMINPALWREFFRPRYQRQFDLAHSYGMHVYFHSCGYCYDIIADLIDIGADMLNLNQPNIFGIEHLGEEFGGKVCFVCPVDIQTTAIKGDLAEIRSDVARMIHSMGRFNGGFIGLVENYHVMGFVSDETRDACIQAFQELGVYKA